MYNPGLRHTSKGELASVARGGSGNVVWYLPIHGAHGVGRLEAVRSRRGRGRLRAAAAGAVRLREDAPDAA